MEQQGEQRDAQHGQGDEHLVAGRRSGAERAEAGDEQHREPETLGEVAAQRVPAAARRRDVVDRRRHHPLGRCELLRKAVDPSPQAQNMPSPQFHATLFR